MLSQCIRRHCLRTRAGGWRALASGAKLMKAPEDESFSLRSGGLFEPDEALDDEPQLTPSEMVELLDQYIVGQTDAKRCVSVALRNRWRRHRVGDAELGREITPKNILMIGPTGVGKTEIARRIATLVDAPFIKTESTRFTEVGFHGADVESIIKDLVAASIAQTKQRVARRHKQQIAAAVERHLLELLTGAEEGEQHDAFLQHLRSGELDDQAVTIDMRNSPVELKISPQHNLGDVMRVLVPGAASAGEARKERMTIREARKYLEQHESERLVSEEAIVREALHRAEQDGIVFIDEIDKVAHAHDAPFHSGDASNEGVQRDLLPLIEGSTVQTKFGEIDTSKILFIASGAFHSCRPSDLLPELQGRLPVRVTLDSLTEDGMYRILTEPKHNLIRQQVELLKTDGAEVTFTDDGVREIARLSMQINDTVENIGARRLHTVLEKLVEEISYAAPDMAKKNGGQPVQVTFDAEHVRDKLSDLLKQSDLSKFIL